MGTGLGFVGRVNISHLRVFKLVVLLGQLLKLVVKLVVARPSYY